VHKFTISKAGTHVFSVSQKGKRMFQRDEEYDYSAGRMFLLKFKGASLDDGFEFIDGAAE